MSYRARQLTQQEILRPGEETHLRMYEDLSSPYSAKVRSYFHYKEIPYRSMRTTLDIYTKRIVDLVGAPIIPVILTPENGVLQDSTPILAHFETLRPERPALSQSPGLNFLIWLLEDFADEYLVRFSMHFRWGLALNQRALSYRIARRFSYGQDHVDIDEGARKILARQSKFDSVLGFSSEEIRRDLDRQADEFFKLLDEHFKVHSFLFGERPSIADFAFFGQIWAHTFNDPASTEILETRTPYLVHWLEMIDDLGDTRGARGRSEFGDFFTMRLIPESLQRILAFAATTWLPLMRASALASKSDATVFECTIRDLTGKFKFPHYKAWCLEQLQLCYEKISGSERTQLDTILTESGILPGLMTDGIHHNGLFDGFNPPHVMRGAMDSRTLAMKNLRDRRTQTKAPLIRPD